MRYIVFILLLLPFMAFGQYPDGPSNPIRLGVQTTANGLAYTSDTGPTLNPANDTSAYLWLDTLAGRLWYWDNGAWDTLARYWVSTDDQTLSIDSTGRVFSLSIEGGNTITFEDTKNTISNTGANGTEIYYYTGSQWNRSGLYVDGFNNTYLSISDYNSAPDSLLVISSQKIKRTAISDVFGASIHEENAQNTNLTISQSEVEDHARVVCAINKQSAHVNDIEVELPAPTAAMAGKRITLNIEDDDIGVGEEININIAGGASRLRIYPATTQVNTYTPVTGTGFIVLNLYVVYSHDAGAYIYDVQ